MPCTNEFAAHAFAGGLAESEPDLLSEILFGALECLLIDDLVGNCILEAWTAGKSLLRRPFACGTVLARLGEPEATEVDGKCGDESVTASERKDDVEVVACTNGPLLMRGEIDLRSSDGEPIGESRNNLVLCRCGVSAIKPFCDGTHKLINFKAQSSAHSGACSAAGDA